MPDGNAQHQPVVSILMPVFNELTTVERAIEETLATDGLPDFELIVVDDGSTDGTREILRAGDFGPRVRIVFHDRNQGKGAAVRTALRHARGRFSTILDADLEYSAADLVALLEPLLEGLSRAAFGVRAFDGYTSHSYLFVLGNRGVTWAANVLFNVYLRDLMTCHKAIESELFRTLPLTARGFDIEPEIVGLLLRRGVRIFEVPVRYRARSHQEGKKLTKLDGLRVLRTLVRCRFAPASRTISEPVPRPSDAHPATVPPPPAGTRSR
jgi:glycosyltransferase involved in cell wall biosynthesis